MALRSIVLFHQFVFLATGVFQTLGAQWLYYQGAADKSSFLTIAANYLGMALVYFISEGKRNVKRKKSDKLMSIENEDASFSELKPREQVTSASSKDDAPLSDKNDLLPIASPMVESKNSEKEQFPVLLVFLVSLLDFAGHICATAGLFIVGSGLYQVISSAVVINTAIISRLFLKKVLHRMQWLAVFVIVSGLCISAFGNIDHEHHHHGSNPVPSATTTDAKSISEPHDGVTFGLFLTLVGTLFFACVYVLNELILTRHSKIHVVSPEKVCGFVGMASFSMCMIYILLYTLPNWEALVSIPMNHHNGDPLAVSIVFGLLVFASFLHSFSYFRLLRIIGATSTGVLTALRAVCVFSISAMVFCNIEEGQCFNRFKAFSTLIVCLGVVAFSRFSK